MSDEQGQAGEIMRYSFLLAFANDGVIDAAELAFMERLALRDHVVDDDERMVLRRILDRINPATATAEVRAEIDAFRRRYGI